MPTAIVTLGRLPKGLDICRALHGAGWRIVVAEPSRRHLCGLSRSVARSVRVPAPNDGPAAYVEAMLETVRREGASLVVPVSEEVVNLAAIGERLPHGVRWFGMAQGETLALHDKMSFHELARSLGLAVPRTALLGTPQARDIAARADIVLKPTLTCAGQGLAFLARGAELPKRTQRTLVQERLSGRHSSTFSMVHEGRVIGTVVYRPLIVSGTVAAAFERIEGAREATFVREFVAGKSLTGFVSFDFIADERGEPRAIECNPRATSGIHFVEPASLARALTAPETTRRLAFRPQRRMHQFWPVLTEVQRAMFRPGRGYLAKMGQLVGGREVNWSWRDPLPVLAQPWAAWDILSRAMRERADFGAVATRDIAWTDASAASCPASVGPDEFGAALADHDGRGVGVAADDTGHDGRIGDAQAAHAAHP